MFDVTQVKKRHFEFRAPDNGKVLHLEPPKLKTLAKVQKLKGDVAILDLASVVAVLISKNREKRKVSQEQVMDWLDQDQLTAFLSEFVDWISQEHDTDPN